MSDFYYGKDVFKKLRCSIVAAENSILKSKLLKMIKCKSKPKMKADNREKNRKDIKKYRKKQKLTKDSKIQ